jgi:hypothetical protein
VRKCPSAAHRFRDRVLTTVQLVVSILTLERVAARGEPDRLCRGRGLRGRRRCAQAGDDGISGSNFAGTFTGGPLDDQIIGQLGDDTLNGAGGADWLSGSPASDTEIGGAGEDTAYYWNAPQSVRGSLTTGTATGWGHDRLSGFEDLDGSEYADRLVGNGSSNYLRGFVFHKVALVVNDARRRSSEASETRLDELGRLAHERDLARVEVGKPLGERRDPATAGPLQHAPSFGRRGHVNHPAVLVIRAAPNEAVFLEPADDPGDRGGADLLGCGELTEGLRTAEDEHRERREPCGAQPARRILAGRMAKRVDRRRVEAVGGT